MISDFPWPIFVVSGALLGTLLTQLIQWMQQKQASLAAAERITREAEHKEHCEHKARKYQNNHGRHVLNRLKGRYEAEYGSKVKILEEIKDPMHGPFYITVNVLKSNRKHFECYIIIRYDFVSFPDNYRCHVTCQFGGIDVLVSTVSQLEDEVGINQFFETLIDPLVREEMWGEEIPLV